MNHMAKQCCWVATQATFTRTWYVHMGLCHTAAILSREAKVALFYLSRLAPTFFTARSRVVKQGFFSLSGQYGHRVIKAHAVMSRS